MGLRRLRVDLLGLCVGLFASIPGSAPPAQAAADGQDDPASLSLVIVENAGQFDPAVRFQVRADRMTLWVTEDSIWITRFESTTGHTWREGARPRAGRPDEVAPTGSRRGVNLKLTFPGMQAEARLVAVDPTPATMNYFLGAHPGQWRAGVRTYGAVTWEGLYPGVSLTLTMAGDEPVFAVEAEEGADAAVLRLRVAGAKEIQEMSGRVVAHTAVGAVALPVLVQDGSPLSAQADGAEASFTGAPDTRPAHSHARPARGSVSGAGLEYGTFLGGSENDEAVDLAVGPDGSTYVGGLTFSPDFPTTPGAFDVTYHGEVCSCGDVFVSRIDPAGSTLIYSTFLGGGDTDAVNALNVGADGAAYVGGYTASQDFPTTPGAFDTDPSGTDAFVTKLDPLGADLVYSTFLGGSANADIVQALALSIDGGAYTTGMTSSADFPTTPAAFDTTINSPGDAFVTALNPAGSDLVYSTFLGGDHEDAALGLTVQGRSAYVAGETQSGDFPTTPGAYDRTFNGAVDVFVVALNQTGSALAFGTYLGGSDEDVGQALATDGLGNLYLTGYTASPDYPTTPGAYDPTINSFILYDAFATKLDPFGSALRYSTFLGGEDIDLGIGVSVGQDGSLTLTGTTYSANFPTTPGAFDRSFGRPVDAFVSRFDPTGGSLLYGSFLGGGAPNGDTGNAITSAGPGTVSVTGATDSADFPTTPGAYDTTFNGVGDGFVATLRVARTMHVDRIVPRYRPAGPAYWVGAAVRVLYGHGSPVEGAKVTVEVAYPGGGDVILTQQTTPQGIAVIVRPAFDSGTYLFTVLDVTEPGSVYDPSQNGETADSVTIP